MNTDNICKALYALPGGAITPKSESIASQMIIALVGVALLTINSLFVDPRLDSLFMALLTCGVAMVLYGIVVGGVRYARGRKVPYDNELREYMKYRERYFDREFIRPIMRALERGDIEALDTMPTTNIAQVVLVEYSSKYRKAYSLMEYHDTEYRVIGEPTILDIKQSRT